ncbi:phenoloxidase-activating factor 2-like isoform X2 [Pararge aegeria]|uniref:phenoloxidase-activating factor 2-like isoform X2 n=1 Tax=Pararge aegeria TaxID=116150 RepID=UPI0019D2319E|nr:phenoloxidase-activating factor 2-like isoform X2 [Pararge aegeria]
MLLPLLFLLTVEVAHLQNAVDPALLVDIFGTPPTPSNQPPRLEEITVRPTESGATFTNSNGEECQCVPYYLCDKDLNGVFKNNVSTTGWGVLDVRFGANDDCQESVERCCKDVLPEPAPVVPDPTKLKGCGYRNPNGLDFQITGGNGNEAQFGEFPWVVALLAANGSYAGVGVLIHPQVVLTGAHIASKFQPGTLVARAGEWDTQTNKERFKSQERIVDGIVVREDFNPKSLKNDLALLHLQSPFELDQHISTLCLPEQDEEFDNYRGCIANGWGKNVFGRQGRYAVILKKVEVNMVPFDRCSNLLRKTRLGNSFKLHRSFVCAGGEEGKDTCQGDGGAPLACPIGNDRYKLSGLVAWGIGCGQKDVPAVYARVAMFRRWLDDVMRGWGFGAQTYSA